MIRILLIAMGLWVTCHVSAMTEAQPKKQRFVSEFKKYKRMFADSLERGDKVAASSAGEKVLALSKLRFGPMDKNTLAATVNLAFVFSTDEDGETRAFELLKPIESAYVEVHKDDIVKCLEFYLLLGRTADSADVAEHYLSKILVLTEKDKADSPLDPCPCSDRSFEGKVKVGMPSSEVILDAYAYTKKHLANDDPLNILAGYQVARFYGANNQLAELIDIAKPLVEVLVQTGVNHPYEIELRLSIAKAAVKLDREEELQQQFRALATMKNLTEDEKTRISRGMYRETPEYPLEEAIDGNQGVVRLGFTITETGHVTDVKVIDSSGWRFSRKAIAALREWRFVPRWEKGTFVANPNQKVELWFYSLRSPFIIFHCPSER